MTRIRTAARLHFGLLALPDGNPPRGFWPDRIGGLTLPARWFGGVGLMVQEPGIALTAEPASHPAITQFGGSQDTGGPRESEAPLAPPS